MVAFDQITAVVQGPVDPVWTARCMRSLRERMPGTRIVLSTQEGASVSGLDGLYDDLVRCDDKVFVFRNEAYDAAGNTVPLKQQNLNRQIQTSREGLARVTTPYALKLRSDMVMEGLGFLDAFAKYQAAAGAARCVKERLVVGCHTTRVAKARTWFKHYRCPFNVTDFVVFGRTEDLRNLWDIPYIGEAEAFYFQNGDADFLRNWGYRVKSQMRLLPEQHVWVSFLQKFAPVDLRCFYDNRAENVARFEAFVGDNLIVLDQSRLGISLPKQRKRYINRYFDFTFGDWLYLYRKHAEGYRDLPLLLACRVRRTAYLAVALPSILAIALLNRPMFAHAKHRLRQALAQ